MKIAYTFDTTDYSDALQIEGNTDTGVAAITVTEDGEGCGAEVRPSDLRAFSAALLEVADRLDPPEPSLAVQLDRVLTVQSGFPMTGPKPPQPPRDIPGWD